MASIAGNLLSDLATAVAAELGPAQVVTATADSASTTTLVASGMIDTEAPTEKYGGRYLWCLNDAGVTSLLGQQGRVTRGGFAGATGTFTFARAFANVTNNFSQWLLSGAMPVLDEDGMVGIRTCINRALRKLWTVYRYPITSTGASVDEYDLGSLFWAARHRFRRLLDPDPSGTGHPAPSAVGWEVVPNLDTWVLQLGSGFPSGDVFYLECEVPLNYRLYLSGSWASQSSATAGLVLPTDKCLGEWTHVVQCSAYECMRALAQQAGGARKAYWEGRANEQRAVVAAIKAYQMEGVEESLGEGPSAGPGSWSTYRGDKGFWGLA